MDVSDNNWSHCRNPTQQTTASGRPIKAYHCFCLTATLRPPTCTHPFGSRTRNRFSSSRIEYYHYRQISRVCGHSPKDRSESPQPASWLFSTILEMSLEPDRQPPTCSQSRPVLGNHTDEISSLLRASSRPGVAVISSVCMAVYPVSTGQARTPNAFNVEN